MKQFFNRNEELTFINRAIDSLVDRERLFQNPIIGFYGIEGIGKTTLLRKIEELCAKRCLSCLWADMANSFSFQVLELTREILKEKEPVVLIVDSLDVPSEDHVWNIATEIHSLIESNNLLVVLASKIPQRLNIIESITGKLTALPLCPFDQNCCEAYLANFPLSHSNKEIIYEWTRGYPLAMNVMIDAILNYDLDPDKEQDRRHLLSILIDRVIYRTLLSQANVFDHERLRKLLTLLSVPRCFNLIITRHIFSQFAPEYELGSRKAYVELLSKTNAVSGTLSWDLFRANYSIDTLVRNILLNQLKIEQPSLYSNIHFFLASINRRLAQEVVDSDRIRYLQEFLYHSAITASSSTTENLPLVIETDILQIIQEEPSEFAERLFTEVSRDRELKASLGKGFDRVESLFLNQS